MAGRIPRGVVVALAIMSGSVAVAPASPAAGALPPLDGGNADFDGDGYGDLAVGAPGDSPGGAVSIVFGSPDGLTGDGTRLLVCPVDGRCGYGAAIATGDFDADGYDDLAVGAPDLDERSGGVFVHAGTPAGPADAARGFVEDDIAGGASYPIERFGSALAVGDVNGDGYDDLAIGIPWDRPFEGKPWDFIGVGGVAVLLGGPGGLSTDGAIHAVQGSALLPGRPEDNDQLGRSLALGDLDDDGFDDLAVGAPAEQLGRRRFAGCVMVAPGSATGLGARRTRIWTQDSAGVAGTPEVDDEFGKSVAIADLDVDGYAELAVGVPGESIGRWYGAGAVHVLRGSASGVTAAGSRLWHQDTLLVPGRNEHEDHFGWSLTAADFGVDGINDLVVGVAYESYSTTAAHLWEGGVVVLPGTPLGPTAVGSSRWDQDSPGVPGARAWGENWGWSVSAGHFDDGPSADLVVGALRDDIPATATRRSLSVGGANVLYGGPLGVTAQDAGFLRQGDGAAGRAEEGDLFGASVAG